MTEPEIEQELERLFEATRAGTEPDAHARGRVRAAVALGLVGAGGANVAPAMRWGRGAKLWLLSALSVALFGVALWWRPARPPATPTALVPPVVPSALAPTAAAPSARLAAPADSRPGATLPSPSAAEATLGPPPSPPPSRSAAKAQPPDDELTLVSSMQLALRSGNATQVLALATEHARRFPNGALAQEREGARAIARCQLAQPDARAAILSAFEQRYPASPYSARAKAACTP